SRLKSDPLLSDMLHQVLNRIAGIRSSAEILSSVPELTETERERFLGTINGEARDLTGVLKQLVSYFDQSASRHKAISPLRELEDAIIAANNNFPFLEGLALELRNEISQKIVLPEGDIATALKRRFGIACHIRQEIAGRYAYDIGTKTLYFRLSTAAPTRR